MYLAVDDWTERRCTAEEGPGLPGPRDRGPAGTGPTPAPGRHTIPAPTEPNGVGQNEKGGE